MGLELPLRPHGFGHGARLFAHRVLPDEIWLPIIGYPFALAIGVGMIEGDFHWLSDIVAGGLIGFVDRLADRQGLPRTLRCAKARRARRGRSAPRPLGRFRSAFACLASSDPVVT